MMIDDQRKGLVLLLVQIFEERKRLPLGKRAVVLLDVAHAALRQQLQPPLHLRVGVAQHVRGDLGIGHHRRQQVRNVFVQSQFQPLGIDHHHLQLVGCRLVQHGDDQRIEKNALARSGRSGDQQVRHLRQIGDAHAPDQVLPQRQRQPRGGVDEVRRFDHFAQHNRLPVLIRHLDAHRGFPRNALDQNRFGAQRQAQIVGQSPVMRLYLIPASGLNS